MAFNPLVSFQKYRRFWMSMVLLLCMITFVLCTGVGGDLGDRIMTMFRGRGGRVLAELNGSSIYSSDFYELRERRNVANDFMRKACDIAIRNLEAEIQNLKLDLKSGKIPEDKRKEAL